MTSSQLQKWLLEQRSKVFFKLSYYPENERDVKIFIDKFEGFAGGKWYVMVL